jgi:hypothetical protein
MVSGISFSMISTTLHSTPFHSSILSSSCKTRCEERSLQPRVRTPLRLFVARWGDWNGHRATNGGVACDDIDGLRTESLDVDIHGCLLGLDEAWGAEGEETHFVLKTNKRRTVRTMD